MLTLGGQPVAYQVIRRPRVHQVRLVIRKAGILELFIPVRFPLKDLGPIIHKKQTWILRWLKVMAERKTEPMVKPLQTGAQVWYRGQRLTLTVTMQKAIPAAIEVRGEALAVHLPEDQSGQLRAILQAWAKRQAVEALHHRAQELAQVMGLRFERLTVRSQKTRWGSCSSRRTLSFNWRLILAPPAVLDYVVIHELAHLVEPNHSHRFWQVVERYCPDYYARRAWLKAHGPELIL